MKDFIRKREKWTIFFSFTIVVFCVSFYTTSSTYTGFSENIAILEMINLAIGIIASIFGIVAGIDVIRRWIKHL